MLHDRMRAATYSHFVGVVPICEQTLGGAIPSGGYVLGERLLGVDAAARAKIGQFKAVVLKQDIFWLNITMEHGVIVHMLQCLQELIPVGCSNHSNFKARCVAACLMVSDDTLAGVLVVSR